MNRNPKRPHNIDSIISSCFNPSQQQEYRLSNISHNNKVAQEIRGLVFGE